MTLTFRPYRKTDYLTCLELFDSNCPEFFDPDERRDYQSFLEDSPEGYEVCEKDGRVLGVFGLYNSSNRENRISWLMVDSTVHGTGIGAAIMERVIHLGRTAGVNTIGLATSQKVAPFYERYGAQTLSVTKDGYGPGLDWVEMELAI